MSGMPVRYEGIVWARLRWGRDGRPVRHAVIAVLFVVLAGLEAIFAFAAFDLGEPMAPAYALFAVVLAVCAWHQFTDAHFARRVAREQAKAPPARPAG